MQTNTNVNSQTGQVTTTAANASQFATSLNYNPNATNALNFLQQQQQQQSQQSQQQMLLNQAQINAVNLLQQQQPLVFPSSTPIAVLAKPSLAHQSPKKALSL